MPGALECRTVNTAHDVRHIRVNTLVATPEVIADRLRRLGLAVTAQPWAPEALIVACADTRALTELPDYAAGAFLLQNHASLLPVLALDPQPGDLVLDVCAAPGGKTAHLAARMGNSGQILANDVSLARWHRMNALLRQLGVSNTRTVRGPGEQLWRRHAAGFDRVLLDAPCSMLGTDTPSRSAVKALARQQQVLLRSAATCLRPGGVLVYSTCTITAEENESVIAAALARPELALEVVPVDLPGAPLTAAQTVDPRGRSYPAGIAGCRRVEAGADLEGFFIARLRRRSPSE